MNCCSLSFFLNILHICFVATLLYSPLLLSMNETGMLIGCPNWAELVHRYIRMILQDIKNFMNEICSCNLLKLVSQNHIWCLMLRKSGMLRLVCVIMSDDKYRWPVAWRVSYLMFYVLFHDNITVCGFFLTNFIVIFLFDSHCLQLTIEFH